MIKAIKFQKRWANNVGDILAVSLLLLVMLGLYLLAAYFFIL